MITLPNMDNNALVDRAVDILANLYNGILKKHHLNNQSIDFSGLSKQIMTEVEQGSTDKIESIINKYTDTKIRNYDTIAGELAARTHLTSITSKHRKVVQDLIGFGKKWNSQCAEAIARNVKIEQQQEGSFRETLTNFKSDGKEPSSEISIDEALQRNAQSLYERTGNIPEGYTLDKDGQVRKDRNLEDTPKVEPKETSEHDMQL